MIQRLLVFNHTDLYDSGFSWKGGVRMTQSLSENSSLIQIHELAKR